MLTLPFPASLRHTAGILFLVAINLHVEFVGYLKTRKRRDSPSEISYRRAMDGVTCSRLN